MKKTALLLPLLLILASCSSLPGPIDDKYMVQKTAEENDRLGKIEKDIIEKNRIKKTSEDALEIKLKVPELTEKEIALLEKENKILRDQVDLYTKYKDARNLEIRKVRLSENEADLQKKKTLNELQRADIKLAEADLEVKRADLAVSVAELEFEKSKIAASYRDKTEPADADGNKGFFAKLFSSKNDPDDKYGYKKYGTFLEQKKEEMKKAKENYTKAEKEYNEAKKKIEAVK